jgi:hypothetical protein
MIIGGKVGVIVVKSLFLWGKNGEELSSTDRRVLRARDKGDEVFFN